MHHARLLALCLSVLAGFAGAVSAAAPRLQGTDTREHARQLAAWLAKRSKLPADGWACRYAGAALADHVRVNDNGKPEIREKFVERPLLIFPDYKAICAAIDQSPTPPEYKELAKRHYARLLLWPIWQAPPDVGVQAFRRRMGELQGRCELIRLQPNTLLADELARRRPAFQGANRLQRLLVYRALAELNPFMEPLNAYVAARPAGDAAWLEQVGPDLMEQQSFNHLEEIDPELRMLPAATRRSLQQTAQGEFISVPLNADQHRICGFRVPPLVPILVPDNEWFDRQTDPQKLDLKNLWLRDLSPLRQMHPQAIDLAGCRVSDLSPLAGMSSLRRLRLDHNPVRDLSPLRGLKLTHLDLRGTDVKDLSPLKGMPLQRLVLDQTPAEDLRPLLGMPLQHLDIDGTPAGDLTPLTGMPLTYLKLNIAAPYRDFRLLGDIKTLKTIGDVPMHDWFADYDAFRNGAEDQGDEEAEDDCEAPPKPKKPKRSEPDKPANGGLDDLPSLGDEMGPLGL